MPGPWIDIPGATSATLADSGIIPRTGYEYRRRARDVVTGELVWSNVESITTISEPAQLQISVGGTETRDTCAAAVSFTAAAPTTLTVAATETKDTCAAAVSAAVTPVAFNSISPGSPTWVNTLTNDISVVIPSTTRGLLLVSIAYTDGSSHTISGVRLDPAGANTALTQVSGAAKSTAAGNMNGGSFGGVDYFYLKLVGITPGTYTVRVSADSGTPVMVATAQIFEFVNQTTPIGTVLNATGVSASPSSGAISSNTNNMLVGACCAFMASSGADLTTPDTQDVSTREIFSFTAAGLNASHTQGSGSHAMTWTDSSALFGWACCGIELVAG